MTEPEVSHGPSSEAGFTLLETLIALAVLSMGLLGFYSLFSQGLYAQVRSERALDLVSIANQYKEEIANEYAATGSIERSEANARGEYAVSYRVLSERVDEDGRQLIWFDVEVFSEARQGASLRLWGASTYVRQEPSN